MPLRFSRLRRPESLDDLTPLERRQLAPEGDALAAKLLLEVGKRRERIELWEVEDEKGDIAYRVWMYGLDTGAVFKADAVESLGQIFSDLECDDPVVRRALAEALRSAPDVPLDSFLRTVNFDPDGDE